MGTPRLAPMPMPDSVKLAFQLKPMPGYTRERTVYSYVKDKDDPKRRIRTEKVVKETGGYLVTTPNGSSFRVADKEELARMNLNQMPAMVDMESGESRPVFVRPDLGIAEQLAILEEVK